MEKINRISKIISLTITFKKEYDKISSQLETEDRPGKKKLLAIRKRYLYSKMLFYIQKLRDFISIKSSIAIIETQGRTKRMLFNGLSKEEVITYFEGMSIITNEEINILEISEINNQVEEL